MATLGNNLTAANTRNIFSLVKAINVPSFPDTSTLNSLTARLADNFGNTWQAGVWDGSGTLLYSSNVRTDIGTNDTYVFTFAGESLTSGQQYYFGVCCNAAANAVIYYASTSETYDGATSGAETPNPLSSATFSADTARDYAIQIDYTLAGGSIAPLAMSHYQRLRNA